MMFPKFSETFGALRAHSDVFGHVRMCSDVFRWVWMCSNKFGHILIENLMIQFLANIDLAEN